MIKSHLVAESQDLNNECEGVSYRVNVHVLSLIPIRKCYCILETSVETSFPVYKVVVGKPVRGIVERSL